MNLMKIYKLVINLIIFLSFKKEENLRQRSGRWIGREHIFIRQLFGYKFIDWVQRNVNKYFVCIYFSNKVKQSVNNSNRTLRYKVVVGLFYSYLKYSGI